MIEGIDTEAMTEWLAERVEVEQPLTYERVGLGQSNLTYLATDVRGHRLVLRRPPMGEILASAHDVAREHRILAALQSTRVPLPVVHGLCEDPAVADRPVLVVSFVDGLVLDDRADAERLSPAARHAVGLSLRRPWHAFTLSIWRKSVSPTSRAASPTPRGSCVGGLVNGSCPAPVSWANWIG